MSIALIQWHSPTLTHSLTHKSRLSHECFVLSSLFIAVFFFFKLSLRDQRNCSQCHCLLMTAHRQTLNHTVQQRYSVATTIKSEDWYFFERRCEKHRDCSMAAECLGSLMRKISSFIFHTLFTLIQQIFTLTIKLNLHVGNRKIFNWDCWQVTNQTAHRQWASGRVIRLIKAATFSGTSSTRLTAFIEFWTFSLLEDCN